MTHTAKSDTADLRRQVADLTLAWTTVAKILGADPHGTADDVFALARRLAANRNPDQLQLSWDAVPDGISRTELERRILLATHHLHYTVCGHTSTALTILRDGVPPHEPTRCAPPRHEPKTIALDATPRR